MAYLFLNQAFNIVIGDDPGVAKDNDKKKIVGTISLPDLEEMTAGHHPGGSRMGINFGGMGMNPLMVRFALNGWDPQAMSQFGIFNKPNIFYTMWFDVRNKNGGASVQVRCVTRGRMTKSSSSQFTRGSMLTFDHEINEIDVYQLFFDGKEKYDFSFWDDIYKVDGVPQNTDELTNLGG